MGTAQSRKQYVLTVFEDGAWELQKRTSTMPPICLVDGHDTHRPASPSFGLALDDWVCWQIPYARHQIKQTDERRAIRWIGAEKGTALNSVEIR
jgi:hypothetical protein